MVLRVFIIVLYLVDRAEIKNKLLWGCAYFLVLIDRVLH